MTILYNLLVAYGVISLVACALVAIWGLSCFTADLLPWFFSLRIRRIR